MKDLFLFITANLNEKEAFEKIFEFEKKEYIKGKSYKIGKFGMYDVAYIHIDEQGISSPITIPLVGELIREIEPIGVVMVGIAFGADEQSQKIGDVLISKNIITYDPEKIRENDNEYKENVKEAGFQLFNAFSNNEDWIHYIDGTEISTIHRGTILTGSKLINNRSFRNKLINDFEKYSPIGGEMEAYGIYSICKLHGVAEWIIVKGICDWAYDKDNKKEEYQKIASKAAIDFCYHIFTRKGIFDSLLKSINKNLYIDAKNDSPTISMVQHGKNSLQIGTVSGGTFNLFTDSQQSSTQKKYDSEIGN